MKWCSISVLVLLSSLYATMSAQRYCITKLEGQWYDPNYSERNAQFIFRFENSRVVFAVTPNLAWATGLVRITAEDDIMAQLDNGDQIKGKFTDESCQTINWTFPVATWIKIPSVKQVHVVFMNHLDVGYNGIPKTGFINNVLNTYFQEYFPRAIWLGYEMQNIDPKHGFVYTTHPWLLNMYMNCPPDFSLNGIKLYCPTDIEKSVMEQAIQEGLITWHAGPMNMQIELMNKELLSASIQIARQLTDKYNPKDPWKTVLSQRDVPGMTAAAIPTLIDNGIKGVSVGVNPGSSPPAVPKIFQWKLHQDDKESIIGMWNAGGYPLNPGNSLSNAGGISIFDSTISEVDGQALVFAFRTDNSGPPLSLEEIHTTFDILEQQFEGAEVIASTLDKYLGSITKDSLPTVVGEIGDTWIQGIASDPVKMAEYRYGAKALQMCVTNKDCVFDEETMGYLRFLVKLPEHTWGLPSVDDTINWSNRDFQKQRDSNEHFKNGENSWSEQKVFFNMTREIARNATNTKYSDYIENILSQNNLVPYPDSFIDYDEIDPQKNYSLESVGIPVNISFGSDGSISSLIGKDPFGALVTLVDNTSTIGTITYHTYNQTDYDFVNAQYSYYGNAGYNKPNVTANAHPKSGIHSMKMTKLYQSKLNPAEFCTVLTIDKTYQTNYGAPLFVWSCVKIMQNPDKSLFPLNMSFKLSLISKGSTRLPETTMFSFTPKLQNSTGDNQWDHQMFKIEPYTGASKAPTGGIKLDSVNMNGSFYQHAVEELYMIDSMGQIVFKASSVEVPLVCPIFNSTTGFKTPNPLPILSRPDKNSKLRGFAFNMHNNVWNTNYPLWYPYEDSKESFRVNFDVSWDTAN